MILTYRFRLRDKHAAELNRQARAVNVVWNYCNEMQQKAAREKRRWLTWQDLQKLTAGSSKDLDLHSHTIQQVCQYYDNSRRTSRKAWLRFRGHGSLGWVPFNNGHVWFDGKSFVFRRTRYEPMHLRDTPAGTRLCAGSFNQDANGRWYINALIDVERRTTPAPNAWVGIDLGLASLATLSDGGVVSMPAFFRKSEARLGNAQRARKTIRARAIHTKVRNRRRDFLHKASAKITKEFGLIIVGDVSPSRLSQTWLAKSVLDAGWSDFKRMLSYKAIRHGGCMLEVSEAYTSQTCSECGSLPPSRPKGIAGLRNRMWRCDCGAVHDRDVNAARNILAIGLDSLAGGAAQMRSSQTPADRGPHNVSMNNV